MHNLWKDKGPSSPGTSIEPEPCILGLQPYPRDKAATLGVNTIDYFREEFTWK